MLDKTYLDKRWSKYKLGKISWTEHVHPSKNVFINLIQDNINSIKSVLEVGPAEMVEYQEIIKCRPIDYTILDISTLFLNTCKEKFPEVKTIHGIMEEPIDGQFDLVYGSRVLEHSHNVGLAIKNLITSAKYFCFIMFKWAWMGDLESTMIISQTTKMNYYSSYFNIQLLLNEISSHGKINFCQVCHSVTGKLMPLIEFYKTSADKGNSIVNRTGDYLIIIGENNGQSK